MNGAKVSKEKRISGHQPKQANHDTSMGQHVMRGLSEGCNEFKIENEFYRIYSYAAFLKAPCMFSSTLSTAWIQVPGFGAVPMGWLSLNSASDSQFITRWNSHYNLF